MARMESPERTTTVSAKLTGERLEKLEEYCDERDVPKSEVIRRGLDTVLGNKEKVGGRVPPAETDLAKAYKTLYRMSSGGGWIRQDRALSILAQEVPGYNKNTSYGLLRRLAKRSYLKLGSDAEGRNAAVYIYE